jgi:hypothetical protein
MKPQDPAASRHHAQHDLTLIAGFAADDQTAIERARAQALVDACTDCSSVRDDLVAIANATHALPAARAPRDFRITAEQAARLRRTGWLGALLAPFAGARSAAKPLATAFTTLGLVGVFVAAAVPGIVGGAASMAAPEAAPNVAGNPGPVASAAAPGAQFGPQATTGPDDGYGTKDNVEASGSPLLGATDGGDSRDQGAVGGGRVDTPVQPTNGLLLGSVALLAVGLVLFGLRFAARRLR